MVERFADRAVDANHVAALLVQVVSRMMAVLAGLAVADDQLALPAPMGIIESMDLIPVCSGSRTGCRHDARAMRRSGMRLSVRWSLPSSGNPRGLTRGHHRFAHWRRTMIVPVRLTVSPSCQRVFAEEHRADLIFSRWRAIPKTSCGNASIFAGHRFFQTVDARDAIGLRK